MNPFTRRGRAGRARAALRQAVAVLVFGAPVAALAQVPPTPTVPPGIADYQDMIVQYEAAQAAAHRPGDEALACDAIRTELDATVNNPAMQEYVTSTSEQAQRDMEYAQAAMAGTVPGVPATTIPTAPDTDPTLQAAELAAAHAQQLEQLNAIMPLLMRAQRLSELAALKACDWLSEGGYSLPTPEPVVPLE